jgi:hypothetical protein
MKPQPSPTLAVNMAMNRAVCNEHPPSEAAGTACGRWLFNAPVDATIGFMRGGDLQRLGSSWT